MSEQYLNPFISQSLSSSRSWGTMSGGGSSPSFDTIETVTASLTSDFTTTSTSLVDVTGLSITLPDITDGKYLATAQLNISNQNVYSQTYTDLELDGTSQTATGNYVGVDYALTQVLTNAGDTDGTTLQIQTASESSGTAVIKGRNTTLNLKNSKISCLGVA